MVEVFGGGEGHYCGAKCYYCGWISQSLDLEEAIRLNTEHEKTHPEYEEPKSLLEFVDELHADHDCNPGQCVCICGCREDAGCSVIFGPLCCTCMIAANRGDDSHGEPAEAHVGGATAGCTTKADKELSSSSSVIPLSEGAKEQP